MFSGGESQHITSPLSLFKSLELHGYLNPSLGGLAYLKEHFALINRLDLSRKVESFVADCQRPQENADQIFPSSMILISLLYQNFLDVLGSNRLRGPSHEKFQTGFKFMLA